MKLYAKQKIGTHAIVNVVQTIFQVSVLCVRYRPLDIRRVSWLGGDVEILNPSSYSEQAKQCYCAFSLSVYYHTMNKKALLWYVGIILCQLGLYGTYDSNSLFIDIKVSSVLVYGALFFARRIYGPPTNLEPIIHLRTMPENNDCRLWSIIYSQCS